MKFLAGGDIYLCLLKDLLGAQTRNTTKCAENAGTREQSEKRR